LGEFKSEDINFFGRLCETGKELKRFSATKPIVVFSVDAMSLLLGKAIAPPYIKQATGLDSARKSEIFRKMNTNDEKWKV